MRLKNTDVNTTSRIVRYTMGLWSNSRGPMTGISFSPGMATLGMVTAAFNTWASDAKYWVNGDVGREDSLDAAYTKLGFGDVKYRYYDVDVGKAGDFVGWSTARKTITLNGKRTTIVALILRGGGYGGEWVSNLHTGTGHAHGGFIIPVHEVFADLKNYLAAARQKGELGVVKLWMGGYSRAGGVTNLVAARLPAVLPQLEKKNTFVYTFAAPAALAAADCPELQQDFDNNHTASGSLKKNWSASNIFNIISSGDVVPRVLPAEWGFYRNGNDRFLPATVVPEELQALNDRSAGMEGAPLDFGRLAVTEETDAMLQSMMTLFGSRQTYHEDYEDAMRCILQCVTTRSEAEVTRGVILDDAAVVAQLRSMEPMQQFPQEKVERCVQAASALSRPLLEKLGNAVPLQAQQIVIPMLAVGLCFELDPETLQLVSDFVLSTITVKGQLSGILKTVLCHFLETYITLLEYYDPADHGMEPYTRQEEL